MHEPVWTSSPRHRQKLACWTSLTSDCLEPELAHLARDVLSTVSTSCTASTFAPYLHLEVTEAVTPGITVVLERTRPLFSRVLGGLVLLIIPKLAAQLKV